MYPKGKMLMVGDNHEVDQKNTIGESYIVLVQRMPSADGDWTSPSVKIHNAVGLAIYRRIPENEGSQ